MIYRIYENSGICFFSIILLEQRNPLLTVLINIALDFVPTKSFLAVSVST